MATIRYIGPAHGVDEDGNPLGVEVGPLNRRHVRPDEAVEVDDELIEAYHWPAELWQVTASSDDPRTVAELREALKARGLPTSGNKAELVERLAQSPATPDNNTDGEE